MRISYTFTIYIGLIKISSGLPCLVHIYDESMEKASPKRPVIASDSFIIPLLHGTLRYNIIGSDHSKHCENPNVLDGFAYCLRMDFKPSTGLAGLAGVSTLNLLIASGVIFAFANFVGDLTIMYRLWNFYDRRAIVIIIPFLASFTGLRTFRSFQANGALLTHLQSVVS